MTVVPINEQIEALERLIREVEPPLMALDRAGEFQGAEDLIRKTRGALKTLVFVSQHQDAIRRAVYGQ